MSYDAARGRFYWWQQIPSPNVDTRTSGGFGVYNSATDPQGPWTTVYYTVNWDIGPGEKADFPTAWMGTRFASDQPGTLYLLFSGADTLSIRKGTIAKEFSEPSRRRNRRRGRARPPPARRAPPPARA